MKLRNKKTGEIVEYDIIEAGLKVNPVGGYIAADSLAEFCEQWEDVPEEPKEYWTVDCGMAVRYIWNDDKYDQAAEAVGLKFDTKEECERAIKKLKALTRLENKGFRFDGYDAAHKSNGNLAGQIFYDAGNYCIGDVEKDLDICFGGEE